MAVSHATAGTQGEQTSTPATATAVPVPGDWHRGWQRLLARGALHLRSTAMFHRARKRSQV